MKHQIMTVMLDAFLIINAFPPKFLHKRFSPTFSMVHLLHRLYGEDAPGSEYCHQSTAVEILVTNTHIRIVFQYERSDYYHYLLLLLLLLTPTPTPLLQLPSVFSYWPIFRRSLPGKTGCGSPKTEPLGLLVQDFLCYSPPCHPAKH